MFIRFLKEKELMGPGTFVYYKIGNVTRSERGIQIGEPPFWEVVSLGSNLRLRELVEGERDFQKVLKYVGERGGRLLLADPTSTFSEGDIYEAYRDDSKAVYLAQA